MAKHSNIIHNAIFWHKIIVITILINIFNVFSLYIILLQIHNCENMERDFVLKHLTAAVHPLDLIPVFYQCEKEYASFLVRNCGAAIVKFCRQNLMVHNPENPNKPVSDRSKSNFQFDFYMLGFQFKLVVVLMFSTTTELKINVQDNILLVLNKRFNTTTRILNLEQFYKDGGECYFFSYLNVIYVCFRFNRILHLITTENNVFCFTSGQISASFHDSAGK